MLSRYAALVKNLRGVVLVNLGEEASRGVLNWLINRFKYRKLGLPPSIVEHYASLLEGRLNGKPFVKLMYPLKAIERLANLVKEELNVGIEAAEAVILASTYVCPVIALGPSAREALKPLIVKTVESRTRLDDKGWKLHFRIADYTVLDLYAWSSLHAEQLWDPTLNYDSFIDDRAKRVKKDVKRYWRLMKGTDQPKPFLGYIDVARLLAERLKAGDQGIAKRLLELEKLEASAGLSIEAAVLVYEAPT
ncbi:MAG: hypothetical protein QXK12_05475 [Candidatus Nezhaarchaeales archaeon]